MAVAEAKLWPTKPHCLTEHYWKPLLLWHSCPSYHHQQYCELAIAFAIIAECYLAWYVTMAAVGELVPFTTTTMEPE